MPKNQTDDANNADAIWGARNIGKVINRTADQTRYLYRTGAFGDAVKKVGHRTLVGNRRKLQQFPRGDEA